MVNFNHGPSALLNLSPRIAFLLVSLALGQLGDGLGIFQGIYLVGIGWNEGSVGLALSLMGLTSLVVQPWAGDLVDKTTVDRRIFLTVASLMTAVSASAILFVQEGNTDHMLMFITKIIEGMASSFIGPCLAALTMASFGPDHFDTVMASNILWGHVGSVAAAGLAGFVSFILYPHIRYCFLVIGGSAVIAVFFVTYLPQGDPQMGRGFAGKKTVTSEEFEPLQKVESDGTEETSPDESTLALAKPVTSDVAETTPQATSYLEVFMDSKNLILCFTGFFFHFANANVLLVLGEMMGHDKDGGGNQSKDAIPFVAGAIVTAQVTMAAATYIGDKLTLTGVGRKPLFLAALVSLPIRCALIIYFRDSGNTALLSTQVLDGVSGGLIGLIQPYLVADMTFGTGRFNVLMGLTASCFGLGATLSNYFGQMVVEKFDHVTSLTASFFISLIPILIFLTMPETMGTRTRRSLMRPRTDTDSPTGSSYGSFDC